ncbi:hypothetical protein [Sulfobacillus harzensis]|uniref:Glucodextranase N-terminal domain-containing protein n=1 Tax=Sulfobacillus harzensis TaxID=2729629 RepID=A0A7Y0Q547_9FIRM|nr:hypothetical protein [Sulfobacillus harzensis]NMP24706.1 hypothetical protein [Sulfobacillus harzensis]
MKIIPTAAAFAALSLGFLAITPASWAATASPAPKPSTTATPYWTVGRNDAIITARDRTSKVWADIVHGSIGETYYPNINTADSRLIELVVVHNGAATPVSRMQHRYRWTRQKALAVTIINNPANHSYQLDETVFTNPRTNALVLQYQLKILSGSPNGYQLYIFSNPHLNNQGTNNRGYVANSHGQSILMAQNGPVSSAIASRSGFTQTSIGYMGSNDGLTQLLKNRTVASYGSADGNIGETGELTVLMDLSKIDHR